uniref:Transposase n=1 Tax=Rhabditophanes sp. KR3021 TaxID=114890 RepID=A0AC35U0N2_9BILA
MTSKRCKPRTVSAKLAYEGEKEKLQKIAVKYGVGNLMDTFESYAEAGNTLGCKKSQAGPKLPEMGLEGAPEELATSSALEDNQEPAKFIF